MESSTDWNLSISVPDSTSAKSKARAKVRTLNGKTGQTLWDLGRCFNIEEQWNNLSPVQKVLFEEYATVKLLEFIELYNRHFTHSVHYRLREKTPEEEEED